MNPTHRLLRRQLEHHLGTAELPAQLEPILDSLLTAIDEAYRQADLDRAMLERSLDLSSQELMQANADLRAVLRAVPDLFLRLGEDGRVLDDSGGSPAVRAAWSGPLTGQLLVATRDPRVGRRLGEALAEVAASGSLVTVEFSTTEGRAERVFEARLFPLLERQKLVVVREVTGPRLAERALLRNQEELERRVARRTAELTRANAELEREIGERRRAERAAEEARARLGRFIEALPAVTYVAEAGVDGRWRYVSPQVEPMLGISPGQLLSEPGLWSHLVHPEDRERFRAEEERTRNGGTLQLEYRILTREGRSIWVRDQAIAALEGTLTVYQGVILDVTERKVLEQQLLQAQKTEAIGRLAGGIAHDFNNMLTAIGGYAELLAHQLPQDSPWSREVAEIRRATARAAELTAKLLAFGRRQLLRPRLLDLGHLIEELEPMLRRLLAEDVELQVVADERRAHVRADPGQLEQVLVNLAVNARDAMPQGGRLTLRLTSVDLPAGAPELETAERSLPPGEYVALEVSDTGIGFTEEVHSHLFEPFFTTKPVGHGTGLGLATVHGIVRQSGGNVRAHGGPGQGAVFTVLLPRAPQEEAAPEGQHPNPPPRGDEAVLLAEDEPAVRKMVVRLLTGLGYRVLPARDGVEALSLAERDGSTRIDALVTDVVMPGVGGRELAGRLRASRPGLPVLFCSGYAEQPPDPAGDERTVFLPKPFSPADLAIRLRALLDGRSG